jgi:hypothetical protein
MTGEERHLTSLDLDRLELGAAGGEERARIGGHVLGCPACAKRREEHAALASHFRAAVLPRTGEALAARRPLARAGLRVFALAAAVSGVAGVAMLARGVLSAKPPATAGIAAEPSIGIKGAAMLHVFARRGGPAPQLPGTVVRVTDGTRLAAGDAVRFVLDPAGLPYVLIASVDGAGQVSIYYPYQGETSAPVDGRATVSVPDSIVLDRAPGPERLFALFSREPISSQVVRQALAGAAAAGPSAIRATRQLPIAGTVQATLMFEKEPP